jgi:2-keto-4-pentenoate hydratase/2-oxohepta-3-ene-1,7-dioic acid hydratase in catechol pathway
MRRVRFKDRGGSIRIGEWEEGGDIEWGDETYDPDEVDILPPVEPTKIVCLGANYMEHIRESRTRKVPEDVPDRPDLFLKGPNAVAGHRDTVTLPEPGIDHQDIEDDRIDHEAELGVVIGEQCRNVSEEDAMDVVAGFTCMNDVSNRNDQADERNWIRGKAFDNAAPLGPVVASPDLVPDDPQIRLWVNGEKKQDSADDEFVFSPSEAIAEITRWVTLEEDDVVAMGTTYGVSPLSDGDTVEIEIEGIGRLEHDVAE